MPKVFLDANIYIAGFVSEEGASHFLLEIAGRKKMILYASKLVLREAERNLRLKAKPGHLKSFRRYLQKTKIRVVSAPEAERLKTFEAFIHPKDLPVLGAALAAGADFLITLDKRHFFSAALQSKLQKPKVMTPRDFLRQIYLKGKF